MASLDADVALLTERRYTAAAADDDWYLDNILRDDGLLQDALAAHGLTSVRLDWSRPDVNWSRYRCAVFRTVWDYFDRFTEFADWLDRVQTQTTLCNPVGTVRWNMDKHYLADLAVRGIPVVPCRYVERGDTTPLAEL